MSATASPPLPAVRARARGLGTIGLKAVMAVTGIVLFGFVLGHMAGNLQVFLPRDAEGRWALDTYGEFLREFGHGVGIWVVRGGLLLALVLHVGAAWRLAKLGLEARPVGYRRWQARESTYASRTMRVTGPLLLLFAVYHLMHLTWGNAHPEFHQGQVHANVLRGLAEWPVALVYLAAMGVLALHLAHGSWSLLQSLGLSHPHWNGLRKLVATALAALVFAGNVVIVCAVWFGWVGTGGA